MSKAIDFAKLLMKRNLDSNPNTYDGNMKLQKLLFFANYISLIQRGVPLFKEKIRAFENGCVVEEVRLRYKNDYASLLTDSKEYTPNFSQDEYDIINLTAEMFGKLSARELSDINHCFLFWKNAYERSKDANGYRDKDLCVVSAEEMMFEQDKLKSVINEFNENKSERAFSELINGVTFYYSSDFVMTDEIIDELYKFSKCAEDTAYSVYIEDGSLVVF